MPTVTVDFPAAIESGANVLAALLTGTFTGDFGPDFGPTLGGGAPVEWLIGVPMSRTDADTMAPFECLTAVFSDSDATGYLDSGDGTPLSDGMGGWVADGTGPWPGASIEWLIRLPPSDAIGQAEALVTARADPRAPVSFSASTRADASLVTEVLHAARIGPPAMGEALASPALDARLPTEALAKAVVDARPPAEILSTSPSVLGDSFAPIEALATQRADWQPVEWAALFRADAAAPVEAVLAVRIDAVAPISNAAICRLDTGPALEALSAAARIDIVLPVEALLSTVRSGAYVEAGSMLLLHQAASGEALTGLRIDPGAQAEAGGSIALAGTPAALEALLVAASDGALFEYLSTVQPHLVRSDQNGLFEWVALFRADNAPVVEWAALFTSDQGAALEASLGIAIDLLFPPTEHAHTAPTVLPPRPFFVASGRIRYDPAFRSRSR